MWITRLKEYVKNRYLAIFACVAVAAGYALFAGTFSKPAPLHEQISEATGLQVSPLSVQWISAVGEANLNTATNFKELAFLAAKPGKKQRDLYIANVKIAPKQTIVEISRPINLTNSDAGDDYMFSHRRNRLFVATRVLGQVRSVTVFDLTGTRLPIDESWTPLQRMFAKLNDFQKFGRFSGIGKTSIRFATPAKEVDFSVISKNDTFSLVLEWSDDEKKQNVAAVDLLHNRTQSTQIQVLEEVRLPKRPVLWVVDSVRELSWIGPGPIEWAEGRFFALKDQINQLKYSISGDENDDDAPEAFSAEAVHVDLQLPEGTEVGNYDSIDWPPKELAAPVFAHKKTGEGEWIPADPDFMKALPNAPPSVYKTYIRTDRRRPYAHVKLYAFDTRQLNLHMVGGHEDPISTTGEVGTGQLPRDKETVENLALVFNGAFKTIHGEYGMMADRTVLLPPKDDAATVATDNSGRVALGSWPKGEPIPDAMTSFRQNMDPLLEDGVINPRKRYLWGFTLGSDLTKMNTIRSGLCLRPDGIIVYAWGDDLTADTLGEGMRAAGCSYGVHLDMNPFHTSLVAFQMEYRGEDVLPKFTYKKLIKDIRFWPDRYVHGAPKDFFYMTLRNASPDGDQWNAEHITQPKPAFLPSVFKKNDHGVSMVAIDTQATRATLLPGTIPQTVQQTETAAANALPEDLGMVVEALLGKWSSSRGQMTNGTVVASLKSDEATLYVDSDGQLQIAPWQSGMVQAKDFIQGDWLIRNGEEIARSTQVIAVARHKNWIFLALGHGQTVSQELLKMGVQQAIAFDKSDGDILIRSNGDMTTLHGKTQNTRDASLTALRFSAARRAPFGTKLDQFFALQESR
ncbi:MAG: hypothetical protein JXX29_00045 [Deltaproteobacteria bacterium]|nr:hypothetical protein [Deltaproteobacteria bacterium]MBN2670027.1 hypothetical protein [Deltaproteobacteria bacterium]